MAAAVLMSSPMKVRTLGEILVSARPLTMACSSTPQARPNAPVHVLLMGSTHGSHTWFAHSGFALGLCPRGPSASPMLAIMTLFFGFVDGSEFENFQLTLAIGGDDGGHVADLFADEAAANRRGGGDESLIDVGLLAGDEFVFDLLILGAVVNGDGRAKGGAVPGNVGEVDERELGHALFKLAEAGVDELLALLGHVVFGVFAQIAH